MGKRRAAGNRAAAFPPSPASPQSPSSSSGGPPAGSEEEDEAPPDEIVETTFEFNAPGEADFHGLKALLKDYLDGAEYDVGQLADTIIAQHDVGTVIKVEGQTEWEACLGVVSALRPMDGGLAAAREQGFVLQLCAFLDRKVSSTDCHGRLAAALRSGTVGFVVCERLVNLPLELAHPLHSTLLEDVRKVFAGGVESLLILSRAVVERAGTGTGEGKGKGPKRRRADEPPGAPKVEYLRPEDEFFVERCNWHCTFGAPDPSSAHPELRAVRLLIHIDYRAAVEACASLGRKYQSNKHD